jgi:hypothetical protein
VPIVESVRQLTDDGEPKFEQLATDGSRVYFTEGTTGSARLAQVSVTGGRTGFVEYDATDAWLQGISPDSSSLLAILNVVSHLEAPARSIPISAREPRQLGEMPVSQATYFPDGRLLLIKGKNIFVADKDGLNPRQLLVTENHSLVDFAWNSSISPDGKRIVVTLIYRLLRWGQPYVDQGSAAYEHRYLQQRIKNLIAKATDLGYELTAVKCLRPSRSRL